MNYGLDVDGVLSNFGQGIINKACELGWGCDFPADSSKIDKWVFSGRFMEVWNIIEKDESFWLSLPRFESAYKALKVIPSPAFYITKRPISSKITSQWLRSNGFPVSPVITVEDASHKLQYLVSHKVEAYVDDLFSTIRQVREAGVNGILYKAPYQVSEDITGLPVIEDLRELPALLQQVKTTTGRYYTNGKAFAV
jgi:hypothetical protein